MRNKATVMPPDMYFRHTYGMLYTYFAWAMALLVLHFRARPKPQCKGRAISQNPRFFYVTMFLIWVLQRRIKKQKMKKLLLILLVAQISLSLYAQTDTIFFADGRNEGCTVSKITDKEIEYSYPGESLINVVKKNTVLQIKFASGRTQIFTQAPSNNDKHGEFLGIAMGGNLKDFLEQLKAKGARFLEYQDEDEVKLEAQFMTFESADIYVHYNQDKIVTFVDVQQNNAGRISASKECKAVIDELNSKYELVKEGANPRVVAFYRWEWSGDNLRIVFRRGSGYSRPHLTFYDTVFGIPEEED